MKVKCIKIINEHTQKELERSNALTIGREYIVLAIEVHTYKNYILIVDDSSHKAPHLHDAKQFEITSHTIPSNWSINPGDINVTTLGPQSWQESDFWEKCFEGNEKALEIYRHEAGLIYKESEE